MFPDWQGDLLIGGLVAEALVRLEVDAETGRVTGEERVAEGIRPGAGLRAGGRTVR